MATRKPVFVRLPEEQVARLQEVCYELGMTKQAFVSAAVVARLDRTPARAASAGVGSGYREVLDLEGLAELLEVDVEILRGMVEAGDVPGRRVGDDWRFSREAIHRWLAGPSPRDAPSG